MIAENNTKNINFIRMVSVLKHLRNTEMISKTEYARAKKYYLKLTGADIVIVD